MVRLFFRLHVEPLEPRDVPATVTNLLDDGSPGSLRSAIAATPAGGVVDFAPGVVGTITLINRELRIDKDLTIEGPGADIITVHAASESRVFNVDDGLSGVTVTVALSGLTVTGGNPIGPIPQRPPLPPIPGPLPGGGILNAERLIVTDMVLTANNGSSGGAVRNTGEVLVYRCAIVGNTAEGLSNVEFGGGLSNSGTATLRETTISGNTTSTGGGLINDGLLTIERATISGNRATVGAGIFANRGSVIVISNSTISGNTADSGGGGIFVSDSLTLVSSTVTNNVEVRTGVGGGGIRVGDGTVEIVNSIVAGNSGLDLRTEPGSTVHATASLIGVLDEFAVLSSSTSNIIGTRDSPIDPHLGPLADNGGPTLTHAVMLDSPAVNAGSNELAAGLPTDQRGPGFPRVLQGRVDMGAYETGGWARAAGAGPGGAPHVIIYDADGSIRFSFLAFDAGFTGGVHVAAGDVTGDSVEDVVVGAGPGGGPHVKVFDGSTGAEIASFLAYDPSFRGGVNVGAGDLNSDGVAEILTGAGPGGAPHVRIYRGAGQTEVASFFAFDPGFRGGVSVDGDVGFFVVGAGPGGAPHVRVLDAMTLAPMASFLAFDVAFLGGLNVAAGDALIAVGAGPGAAPHVRLFQPNGDEAASFLAFEPQFTGGLDVAIRDGHRLWAGAGPGGSPELRAFSLAGDVAAEVEVFASDFLGGVAVA
jgi:hypothetical protein